MPPQKVFLLLSDLRQRVPVAHLAQLLSVAVSQGVVPSQPVTLGHHRIRVTQFKINQARQQCQDHIRGGGGSSGWWGGS